MYISGKFNEGVPNLSQPANNTLTRVSGSNAMKTRTTAQNHVWSCSTAGRYVPNSYRFLSVYLVLVLTQIN